MNKSKYIISFAGIVAICVSATSVFAFKTHCDWDGELYGTEGGRNIAVTTFEHPHQAQAVDAYVKLLRESGARVITFEDLLKGVTVEPVKDGETLIIVFTELPDYSWRAYFPDANLDLHNVSISERSKDGATLNTEKANYTANEIKDKMLGNKQVNTLFNAYIDHYKALGADWGGESR